LKVNIVAIFLLYLQLHVAQSLVVAI